MLRKPWGGGALADQLVATPVPQGRQGGRGGLHDSRAGQGSPAAVVKQVVDIPVPQGRRGGGGKEVFKVYALDRIQQRMWSRALIFQLVAVFKVFSQARVLPHRVDCLTVTCAEDRRFHGTGAALGGCRFFFFQVGCRGSSHR